MVVLAGIDGGAVVLAAHRHLCSRPESLGKLVGVDHDDVIDVVEPRESLSWSGHHHHGKSRFLIVAGPFHAAEEVQRIVGILEQLPALIEPADRRPVVVQLLLCLEAGDQQRIVVAAHQVGVRIEEVQRRRHHFQAGESGEMAHLHRKIVDRNFRVELGQDQPVKAVGVVEAVLQAVALPEAPIFAVDDVDASADVDAAAVGLRRADEIQPCLVQLVLSTAVVREHRPVEPVGRVPGVVRNALLDPAAHVDVVFLEEARLGQLPRLAFRRRGGGFGGAGVCFEVPRGRFFGRGRLLLGMRNAKAHAKNRGKADCRQQYRSHDGRL